MRFGPKGVPLHKLSDISPFKITRCNMTWDADVVSHSREQRTRQTVKMLDEKRHVKSKIADHKILRSQNCTCTCRHSRRLSTFCHRCASVTAGRCEVIFLLPLFFGATLKGASFETQEVPALRKSDYSGKLQSLGWRRCHVVGQTRAFARGIISL